MPTSPTARVIEQLRRAALRDCDGLRDGELLGCFIGGHKEAALAAIVKRHGSMVWGVCRRLLSHHDAEDAFQATFLVLVRKAASIVPREMVGNWLYGVAHQTALQARRTATRRRAREVQVTVMPDTKAVQQDQWPDVRPLLDQELSRLPDIYRAVIVLCDLESRTRKEVARQLRVPEGTVAGRLARARAMLSKRLTQRGVTLSSGALAAVLSQKVASAGLPDSVMSSTISAANLFAAGPAAAAGVISSKVASLTEGVLKTMMMSKLKAVLAVVLMLGFIATGATVLSDRTAARQGDMPPTVEERVEVSQKQEKDKAAFTAWGKEVDGLQAGLGYRPGEHVVYHTHIFGGVTLVVRVRNVGKKEVTFQYCPEFVWQELPDVADARGKPIALEGGWLPLAGTSKEMKLAPGKSIELYQLEVYLRPESDRITPTLPTTPYPTLYGPGKFIIQYKRVAGDWSMLNPPTLSKLATGKLELEVKAEPPPAATEK